MILVSGLVTRLTNVSNMSLFERPNFELPIRAQSNNVSNEIYVVVRCFGEMIFLNRRVKRTSVLVCFRHHENMYLPSTEEHVFFSTSSEYIPYDGGGDEIKSDSTDV